MNKKDLRNKYKALRLELNGEKIEDLSIDVANRMLQLPIWEKSYYHLFLPIEKQKEINTEYLLHILQGKDKNVIVSKSNFKDNTLEHILLTDNTVLKSNAWGIPEPVDGIPIPEEKIEVVFVPLLAFDKNGNRVGYGKGFYDKFLEKCNADTLKIGLSFFESEQEIVDVLPTDISLDICVTPLKTYYFKN
ncbi:5-formyltetrahydrofolate cyclo-ligase [Aquimarina aggregata]|uniref:5-formyltetrahydrofolate cyclo-ligase n=1 Tax=Aquimarina aggregata TaxID=1642818 RepID=A0A162ZGP8_9FLAO|nr:5-formyltetrahydrofolate cyclo-ligase [Aquimarina aggregata]KZS39783.1 5-formyltetrahydrofolate cyclo-ligase [Aquimarina aggregata]